MLKQSSIKYKLTIIIIKQSCCVLTDIQVERLLDICQPIMMTQQENEIVT